MFDNSYIQQTVSELQAKGIHFGSGLSEERIAFIEEKIGGMMPIALKSLLRVAMPISDDGKNGQFPRWDKDIDKILINSQDLIDDYLMFDIKESGFWHESFGEKPQDQKEAENQALKVIHGWPKLIPVYAHRFVVASIDDSPVFSYHGPLDTVYYGYDMADYLSKEFGVPKPSWSKDEPISAGNWAALFNL